MLRKTINISIPLAIPRSVVYYVPFCPRPSLVVTQETLNKLGKVEISDPGPLSDLKQKVAQGLCSALASR